MAAAAERPRPHGIRSMVGFTYRRVPATAFARELVREGGSEKIRHVRAEYLQDWLVDPETPLTWRMQKDRAGSGALGDIGAHIVDLAQFITGQRLTGCRAAIETFVKERPLRRPRRPGWRHGLAAERGRVTVDDAALFTARLTAARRVVRGHAVRDRPQERAAHRGLRQTRRAGVRPRTHEPARASSTRSGGGGTAGLPAILVTEPEHPYVGAWWPAGHIIGYEHGFTHQASTWWRDRRGHRPHPVVRRRSAGPAGARRRRAQRRERLRQGSTHDRDTEEEV